MRNNIYAIDAFRKVHCIVEVDEAKRVIHILDFYGPTSVKNSIDATQKKVFGQHDLVGKPTDWMWLVYSTDGKVYRHEGYSTFVVMGTDPYDSAMINPEFSYYMKMLKRMRLR